MTFDTLSYARRLKQAGVPEAQAEAMADATRELVMQDVATKGDSRGKVVAQSVAAHTASAPGEKIVLTVRGTGG